MNGPTKIRLLIADDHPVVRRGFTALLEDQEDMAVVAEASDGPEAVAAYREHVPDVALIDFRMPGLGGAEVIAAVRAEFPAAQIIIITTYDTDEDLYQAVRAGARGYLLKDTSLDEFTDCIRRVSRGETRLPKALVARLAGRIVAAELTPGNWTSLIAWRLAERTRKSRLTYSSASPPSKLTSTTSWPSSAALTAHRRSHSHSTAV